MWTQIMDVMWRLKQKEEFFMVRDLEIRQKFEFPMHEAACSLHILYFYTYLALLLMSCPLNLQNCFIYVCITSFMYVPPSWSSPSAPDCQQWLLQRHVYQWNEGKPTGISVYAVSWGRQVWSPPALHQQRVSCSRLGLRFLSHLYISSITVPDCLLKVQGSFIRHILNYTGYNQ